MTTAAPTRRPSKRAVADALPPRQLLAALKALQRGDFSHRLPENLPGVDGQICDTFNHVIEMASGLGEDFLELRTAVGRDGKTNRRLRRGDLRGGWAQRVVAVNELLDDLTTHTDEMARVVQAVGRGDLSQSMDVRGGDEPLRGTFLQHARAVNEMVERLSRFGSEVTRVAQEVGVEGKLGAKTALPGVSGTWKELSDSVNLMARNLTAQVREIARVTTAVAQGDLTKTVNIEAKGEILELKNTINTMVGQLGSFADEVTRVAREVGSEGTLGGQAQVKGVSGVWRELTENVNFMANNLTLQVRNIAEVSTAIAAGDLSRKITVEVRGEILELKNTINTMVDQLGSFADEVTRVAREVGTEGMLGGQAQVRGVSGVWRELTENVNSMANNLTLQVRNIAEVSTAIAAGDLSRKITVEARGEILELKKTINTMVDQLGSFADEVTRVAREVGTEGMLGVQAEVKDVSGTWKELTENVNLMASNLTNQVRDIAEVTTAVANGDLSRKITVQVRGEILALKNTINAMVDFLGSFADEVTRVAREVGTEGVLGGQAVVHDVSGIWKELTDRVNSMASNLTSQVRSIADVARAVASGDLSKKITVDARGEVQDLKNTLNAMVDQLNAFGAEVTRVAREVGTEGRLGGQASVEGVRGTWKELTDNVNLMANNLTNQVRDIAVVTTAVARGDLTRKIVVDARGEILELKNTVNTMVDQLSSFADEVTRLATEVGVEGELGGQADVRGVSGTWRDLTDAVNSMASNLTDQVRSISQVATAIAEGDLRKKIVVDARGEILELKNTINTMVDQLSSFADQVTRVAREVGTDGKLGGQASVEGVRGTWKELTDSVNVMASNLTNQVRDIAEVTTAVARGDLTRKIAVEVRGELAELKNTINTMVDQLSSFADEVTRVSSDVGVEGKLGGQARVRGVSGTWKELTDNVNLMASNLTNQVRDIAEVTTAVAKGDLSRKITVEVRGELLQLKNTVNTMVDQLSSFADEVTRVAREVGTEGMLGGQAQVRGVSGTWRELTDNANVMARNLTEQVRGIARVVTAVANGDLKQALRLEARGEIATLVATINDMIGTLSTFADQVSGVAHDVGVEGKLGGQADVPGAAGVWRDLTSNVNELAGNLTRQVRAIGDVATAVTTGDLTRAIDVEARGEVAVLKDSINQMIRTLRETTRANEEQDWLKTNLARFTRMLQGQRDLLTVSERVLFELAEVVDARYGALYMAQREGRSTVLSLFASYALGERRQLANRFELGEGLVGQAAKERKRILVNNVPETYLPIRSALGESLPRSVVVVPILFESEVKGVIELASFHEHTPTQLAFIDQLLESLGIVITTIEATMRTDELLRQSQGMAEELQEQQEVLQRTNEELEHKAFQLTAQRDEVELKNSEIEQARQELEEKAAQLALTSKYKSQFLANMSHELRTPLNSLLILSRQLADNADGNLTPRQVEYAETVHQAGSDLLSMINEVLDLAKVESGTISLNLEDVPFSLLHEYVDRSFRHIAAEKGLSFAIELAPDLPPSLHTDDMRLRQVLRNLLANAMKFTEAGEVRLRISPYSGAESGGGQGPARVSFEVVDTGIGIAKDKQRIIFEAFQQADGSTSRRYGGTGLGLAISREIAALLGGELGVESEPGVGSTFRLVVPLQHRSPSRAERTPVSLAARTTRHLASQAEPAALVTRIVDDDRSLIEPGDRVMLIVEDDRVFASSLLDLARRRKFRGVVAGGGQEAIDLCRAHRPHAITLDLKLPDMDGWVLLDRLKHDLDVRHVPVHVISAAGEPGRGRSLGAIGVLEKPAVESDLERAIDDLEGIIGRRNRELLIVDSDRDELDALVGLLGDENVQITTVESGAEALTALERSKYDCVVIGSHLTDVGSLELARRLGRIADRGSVPIVLRTDGTLDDHQRRELRRALAAGVLREAASRDQVLVETSLLLHRADADLPEPKRLLLRQSLHVHPGLRGRRVLVVDDDVRNIFAITALLEQQRMIVTYAENGHEALARLAQHDDIELVLMDIMMPLMDGYEATRRIRSDPRFADLPVIALTAKALLEDRQRCLDAGASDYIVKPVDTLQLVSLLRVWLLKHPAPRDLRASAAVN